MTPEELKDALQTFVDLALALTRAWSWDRNIYNEAICLRNHAMNVKQALTKEESK
jgi:hypothetical protein